MKRSWPRKVILGCFAVPGALVLLNLLAMGWEYYQQGTIRMAGQPMGLYKDEKLEGGHMLQPGAHLPGETHDVSVNSMGFRGPEMDQTKPPGTLRVWCLGGSTTFDILVSSDAAAWPARLQARLGALTPGLKVEAINAGIPGEVMATNLRDLRRWAATIKPDVVVIHVGPNDLRVIANARFGNPPVTTGWLTELSLYRLLSDLMPPSPLPEEWDQNRLGQQDMEPIRQSVKALVQEARRHGSKVVLTSHGYLSADDASGATAHREMSKMAKTYAMSSEGLIAAYAAMNQLFRDLAQELGITFSDVRSAVGSDPDNWGDEIHFSDAGADAAARGMAQTLVKAGLNRIVVPGTPR